MSAPLPRRAAAEALGTALLVAVVVGSGISAERLSSDDGVQLLINALATVGGLAAAVLVVGPVSGAHLNPIVSAADWWLGRRSGRGLNGCALLAYVGAQAIGGVVGAVIAQAMYDEPIVAWSTHHRGSASHLLAEAVASSGLLVVVLSLARHGSAALTAWTVGGYIGAAYFFTSSTSFANPAVTVARSLTDTFAGIAPSSVPSFVAAQVIGGVLGVALAAGLHPDLRRRDDDVVVPTD